MSRASAPADPSCAKFAFRSAFFRNLFSPCKGQCSNHPHPRPFSAACSAPATPSRAPKTNAAHPASRTEAMKIAQAETLGKPKGIRTLAPSVCPIHSRPLRMGGRAPSPAARIHPASRREATRIAQGATLGKPKKNSKDRPRGASRAKTPPRTGHIRVAGIPGHPPGGRRGVQPPHQRTETLKDRQRDEVALGCGKTIQAVGRGFIPGTTPIELTWALPPAVCPSRAFYGKMSFSAASSTPPKNPAEQAKLRLTDTAKLYDEFLTLRFRARNQEPYAFEWVDERDTRQEYTAALQRISIEYQHRF